ncbi:MAG TPA: serine protease, partial [Archangium sp.]|nr:serine protease [Archangium sp.]
TYRTNTLEGSSGSPCFSQDWALVALHHSGGPGALAKYNEGIPISTLRAHLPDAVRKQLGWS